MPTQQHQRVIFLALSLTLFTSACTATTAELRRRDEEIARMLAIIGTRTFDADLATTRTATARALLTLGYDVLWSEGTSIATGALIEHKSNVGTIIETAKGEYVNVGVVQTNEVLVTRSYEGRFEPMPDGRTRVVLVPKIRFGELDITSQRIERERRLEQAHFDRVFNETQRLLSTVVLATQPVQPNTPTL